MNATAQQTKLLVSVDAYFQFPRRRIAYSAIMPDSNRSATRTFLPLLIAVALMVLVVSAAWAAPF